MLNLILNNIVMNDVLTLWGLYLQDSASNVAEGILEVHDTIMFYLIIVICLVGYLLVSILRMSKEIKFSYKYLVHGSLLEFIWTLFLIAILLLIAFLSFVLLYLSDDVIDLAMTIKCIGYQWYWSYEYSDFINDSGETIQFDSYMVLDDMLEFGDLRLLEVDNRIVVLVDTHIRFVITGGDVIHNFAVLALGIKVDGTLGRLVQVSTIIQRESVYRGFCSELCGVGHSEMLIVIEAVSLLKFLEWLNEQ